MTPKKIAVVGAGGFAREVRWLISEINGEDPRFEFAGFLISDLSSLTSRDSKSEVVGDLSWLDENPGAIDALALGIGTPGIRGDLGTRLKSRHPHLEWPSLIHPTVRFDARSCEIGEGVILAAGTIGTVGLNIGPFSLINLACTLGHEARLGVGCVLNPTVNISGGVELGDRVLIGTGAQVLQYLEVGDDATVGAGAVVNKNVLPGQTVVGIPARPLHSEK